MRVAGEWTARAARFAGRALLALQVIVVGVGVSSPAPGIDAAKKKRDKQERRRQYVEPERERGHVRRRGDIVDKRTHVDKREGWRKVER